ncbi:hypothetical protein CDAR_369341 [Caerostris darwini]|uniref:Uncharacterized protein n=1 Tax=Caerostris darwini TaxID=1538125 RepID=A0AAV4RWM9_9ARAC|nr:hypothetical protein CDAR_369341 [Caerostris darwini]
MIGEKRDGKSTRARVSVVVVELVFRKSGIDEGDCYDLERSVESNSFLDSFFEVTHSMKSCLLHSLIGLCGGASMLSLKYKISAFVWSFSLIGKCNHF